MCSGVCVCAGRARHVCQRRPKFTARLFCVASRAWFIRSANTFIVRASSASPGCLFFLQPPVTLSRDRDTLQTKFSSPCTRGETRVSVVHLLALALRDAERVSPTPMAAVSVLWDGPFVFICSPLARQTYCLFERQSNVQIDSLLFQQTKNAHALSI